MAIEKNLIPEITLNRTKIYFFGFFLLVNNFVYSQITHDEEELISPSRSFSPHLDYAIKVNLAGFVSTNEELPFWMYKNRRGRISEKSNISSWISGKHVIFFTSDSYLISGAGILFSDGTRNGLTFDELYLHFQNTWFYATTGKKQQRELYNGLSSSNRNILWSINSAPIPGLQIGTTRPLFFTGNEGLGFDASWNEYLLERDRYIKAAKIHYKNFLLVYRKNDLEIKGGLNHFVQWAGTSPDHGEQPGGLENYLRIITGRKGSKGANIGDQQNALGNSLGGYELSISKEFRDFKITIFYNHLFEDGSGVMLRNTPDGRYGVFYESKERRKLINSLIYELYYTEHQSYTFPNTDGKDNYFNNSIYRSGWTYENRVIGAPFFIVDPDGGGIINNKFTAHHLGIGGQIGNYFNATPYKVLLSYANNDGVYHHRFRPQQDVLSFLAEFKFNREVVNLSLMFGAEYNSYRSPIYGLGINAEYRF